MTKTNVGVGMPHELATQSYDNIKNACIINMAMGSILHSMELALKHGSIIQIADEGFIDQNIRFLSQLCKTNEEFLGYLRNKFEL